jgi:hypothetical protein
VGCAPSAPRDLAARRSRRCGRLELPVNAKPREPRAAPNGWRCAPKRARLARKRARLAPPNAAARAFSG